MSIAMSDTEYELSRSETMLEDTYFSMPSLMFKYKAADNIEAIVRICDIFINNRIYMPTYKQLNDPFEGLNSRLISANRKERENFRENWRILSLSSDAFLPTLWAYYAGNYSGICIGFQTHNTFDDAQKIEYVNGMNSWTTDPELSVQNDLLKKYSDWSHEKEWRMIRQAEFDGEGRICNDYLKLKEGDVRCVLFGSNMELIVKEMIMQKLPESVRVLTIFPDEESYCLSAITSDGDIIKSTEELEEMLA